MPMQSDLHPPAPWLDSSAEQARAFDSIDDALAAIGQVAHQPPNLAGEATVLTGRLDLDALVVA